MAALTPRDQRKKKKVGQRMAEHAGPRLTETPTAQAAQNRAADRPLPDDTQIRGVQRDTMRDQNALARRMNFLRRNANLASDPMAFEAFEQLRGEAERNRDTVTATRRFFRGQAPGGTGPTQPIAESDQRLIRQAARERRLAGRAEQVETTTGLRGRIAGAREGFEMDRASAGADIATEQARGSEARRVAEQARVAMNTEERGRELELARMDAENRLTAAEAALAEAVDPAERARLEAEAMAAQNDLIRAQGEGVRGQTEAALTETRANAEQVRAQAQGQRIANRQARERGESGNTLEDLETDVAKARTKKELEALGADPNGIAATTPQDDAVVAVGLENISNSLNTLPGLGGTVDYDAIPVANIASVNTHIDKILRGLESDNPLENQRATAAAMALIEAVDAANIPATIQAKPSLWAIARSVMSGNPANAARLGSVNAKQRKAIQTLGAFTENIEKVRRLVNAG